jgi:Tfp pilus assembly protein PilF
MQHDVMQLGVMQHRSLAGLSALALTAVLLAGCAQGPEATGLGRLPRLGGILNRTGVATSSADADLAALRGTTAGDTITGTNHLGEHHSGANRKTQNGAVQPVSYEQAALEESTALEQSNLEQAHRDAANARPPASSTRGVELTPRETAHCGSQLAKARSFEATGQLDEARKIYQELIAHFPSRPEPYHRLGVVADRQKRHREAQALYGEALLLKPLDGQLFNDLGWCFYLQGKFDKAESSLLKAISLQPANGRYRNNLGLVLGQQGRLEEALVHFRRAGSEADAQYNLAFVLASTGKYDEAKARFRMAIEIDPTHEAAREALRGFERYEENPQLADSQWSEADPNSVPYVEAVANASADDNAANGSRNGNTIRASHTSSGGQELNSADGQSSLAANPNAGTGVLQRNLSTKLHGNAITPSVRTTRNAASERKSDFTDYQGGAQYSGAGESSGVAGMGGGTTALQQQVRSLMQQRLGRP